MDVQNLTRDKVREILRTSEGINTQSLQFKARIKDGHLLPATVAHPISSHLHSASPLVDTSRKTLFISMDDMVEALWLVLHSAEGVSKLRNLKTGERDTINAVVGRPFPFECEVSDPQGRPIRHRIQFSVAELI